MAYNQQKVNTVYTCDLPYSWKYTNDVWLQEFKQILLINQTL